MLSTSNGKARNLTVDYSTQRITKELLEEVKQALKNVRGWGSVEIFVQNGKVVQITERNIRKI